jgi:hypothetical protein
MLKIITIKYQSYLQVVAVTSKTKLKKTHCHYQRKTSFRMDFNCSIFKKLLATPNLLWDVWCNRRWDWISIKWILHIPKKHGSCYLSGVHISQGLRLNFLKLILQASTYQNFCTNKRLEIDLISHIWKININRV